ncbi:hypothetical protein CPB84DRAFT_1762880 [Gymnopilus junonius]|uniref:Uncharacterized protein n=1 Tax=Gymnopilus junonius TaxID=109634 RepID=A0A9P5P086_GYMJU|nr:hypothetical protein CPB84DRAFT_1762880 [Gymnopilus junonius]
MVNFHMITLFFTDDTRRKPSYISILRISSLVSGKPLRFFILYIAVLFSFLFIYLSRFGI